MTLGGRPLEPAQVDLVSGWTVLHVAETGSTNADLLSVASAGAVGDRTALVTDHQTAGRGRLDRRWDAPAGENLLCSLLCDAHDDPQTIQHVVALALVAAASDIAGCSLALKWPNDVVLLGDDGSWRKVAGMLSVAVPGGRVIIGIGVNLGWAPEGAATIHSAAGVAPDRWELLACIITHIDRLRAAGTDAIRDAYRSSLDTIGRRVRVHLPDGSVLEGRATGVDDSGELRVLDACAITHRLAAGDVVHLRDG